MIFTYFKDKFAETGKSIKGNAGNAFGHIKKGRFWSAAKSGGRAMLGAGKIGAGAVAVGAVSAAAAAAGGMVAAAAIIAVAPVATMGAATMGVIGVAAAAGGVGGAALLSKKLEIVSENQAAEEKRLGRTKKKDKDTNTISK